MIVQHLTAFWQDRILSYHLIRGLVTWLILEIVGITVSKASQAQIGNVVGKASAAGFRVHVPSISAAAVDATVALMAGLIYTWVATLRAEDRILLGNLGISRGGLSLRIAACGFLLGACTWVLR